MFMSSLSDELTHLYENSETDVWSVSGGHIGVPQRDTKLAAPYISYQKCLILICL